MYYEYIPYIVSAISLIIQIFLCFKTKKNIIRFLPIIIYSTIAIVYAILIHAEDVRLISVETVWVTFAWMAYIIYCIMYILSCGLGWGIWGICLLIKKVRATKANHSRLNKENTP